MGKFLNIRVDCNGYRQVIINSDDIARIIPEDNVAILRTPSKNGSDRMLLRTETIEQLKRVLEMEEVNE